MGRDGAVGGSDRPRRRFPAVPIGPAGGSQPPRPASPDDYGRPR